MALRILLVEDDPDDVVIFKRSLARHLPSGAAIDVVNSPTLGDARRRLEGGEAFDLSVLDYALPDGTGMELLHELARSRPDLPVVICTGAGGERIAVEAMKERAADYILKDDLAKPSSTEAILQAIVRKREEAKRRDQARVLVERDESTGLLRRGKILATLDAHLAQKTLVSCVLMEPDHLDVVADTFGHGFGTFCLRAIADVVRGCLPEAAAAGSYGGHAILLVLPRTAAAGAAEVAERIRQSVQERILDDGRARTVLTMSGGIAGTEGTPSRPDLLAACERAFAEARSAGGNRVASYARLSASGQFRAITPEQLKARAAGRKDLLLGSIAVDRGDLSKAQLDQALAVQEKAGGRDPLGQVLLRLGWLTPARLKRLLEIQRGREVERSQQVEQELDLARRVQEKLLPARLPEIPGLDAAASYFPAGPVGGDFYDAFPLGGRGLAVVIGDVSGHALGSALVMTMVSGVVRSVLPSSVGPGPLLRRLNELMNQQRLAGMFLTLTYLEVDVARRAAKFTSAGHPPAMVLWKDGSVAKAGACGPALGLLPEDRLFERLEEVPIPLEGVRRILLYTDGAVDVRDAAGREFGEERLAQALREGAAAGSAEAIAAIGKRLRAFAEPHAPDDDVTLVALTLAT